jgi:hypothetical protein
MNTCEAGYSLTSLSGKSIIISITYVFIIIIIPVSVIIIITITIIIPVSIIIIKIITIIIITLMKHSQILPAALKWHPGYDHVMNNLHILHCVDYGG